MISRLQLKNFTVFSEADLEFSPQLNVFVGENGSGKTHLLKVMYALTSPLTIPERKPSEHDIFTSFTQKLEGVFQTDSTASLIRNTLKRPVKAEIRLYFDNEIEHAWVSLSQSENVEQPPNSLAARPVKSRQGLTVYIPPQEVLSLSPSFVAAYDRYSLPFDETLRDSVEILSLPPLRKRTKLAESTEAEFNALLGGEIFLGHTGTFFLKTENGLIEAPLLAHGQKKIASLAQFIANGSIEKGSILFWDEPEANLNAKLVRQIAQIIMVLAREGVQVFIATHSLFLLKEIEILNVMGEHGQIKTRFFGLHAGKNGVTVMQGESGDDIGDITALDEELKQTDRFLEANDVARERLEQQTKGKKRQKRSSQ